MKRGSLRKGAALLLALGMLAMAAGCGSTHLDDLDASRMLQEALAWSNDASGAKNEIGALLWEGDTPRFVGLSQADIDAREQKLTEQMERFEKIDQTKLSEEEKWICQSEIDRRNRERALLQGRLLWDWGLGWQTPVVVLERYILYTQKDADDYLKVVQAAGTFMEELLAYHEERAKEGMTVSQVWIENEIQGCRNFIHNISTLHLIQGFDAKIDGLEEITPQQKAQYKILNLSAVTEYLVPACQAYIEGLERIGEKGGGQGVAANEERKAFIRNLVAYQASTDRDIEQIIQRLDERITDLTERWEAAMERSPDALNELETIALDAEEPKTLLTKLEQASQKDFPALDQGQVGTIEISMADSGTGGLTYAPEYSTIYLLEDAQQSRMNAYSQLAESGYPGTFYLCCYIQQNNPELVDKIFYYHGYRDGWMAYANAYAAKWAYPEAADLQVMYQANTIDSYLVGARISLGVNYEGWDKETALQYAADHRYLEEMGEMFWNQAVAYPDLHLSYAIGYLEIMEMKDYAKEELGNAYTDMEFHRAVLEAGPSPFWHVRTYVEAYVERTKAKMPQGQAGRAA